MTIQADKVLVFRPALHKEIISLRHSVLRPNQPLASACYPEDNELSACHWGAFTAPELQNNASESTAIACLSLYQEDLPAVVPSHNTEGKKNLPEKKHWRLRGMAVAPACQGRGIGRQLLLAAIASLQKHSAGLLWCNARQSAVPFYTKLGFVALGETFEIEGIGPHVVLYLDFEND